MKLLTRRKLVTGAAALAVAAPGLASTASAAEFDGVDPALLAATRPMLQTIVAAPDPTNANLAAVRASMASFVRPPSATIAYARRSIAGLSGNPPVSVYVVNAKAGARRPGILHTHGGGFILGDAKGQIADLQEIAQALDCAIVTVDYRLAPETTYAGSADDTYAALLWLQANAAALGVDPARLAVMGESAGGGHAALLALRARDRGQVRLAFQALVYPMLDDRTGTTRTPAAPIGELVWTAAKNRFGWASFLGRTPGSASVPAAAVPARAASLQGLPPTFIGVGSIDLFVDEDIDYARRLIDAHVPTELLVVPGAFHGFDVLARQVPIAQAFTAAKIAALRHGLA